MKGENHQKAYKPSDYHS